MGIREKIGGRKGGELARRCWEEMKERVRKRKGRKRWKGEKRTFLKREDGG